MRQEQFQAVQGSFRTLVGAHAFNKPQAASVEATAAQEWLAVVQEAAQAADAAGKRLLVGQLVLLMYYDLFDQHKWSPALERVVPGRFLPPQSCQWSEALCSV